MNGDEQSKTLILASASPRRREILAHLDIPFTVVTSTLDEDEITKQHQGTPTELVKQLAIAKALTVADTHASGPILAADTVVVLDDEVLGKPKNQAENAHFLSLLSGRRHQVYTGVCLVTPAFSSTHEPPYESPHEHLHAPLREPLHESLYERANSNRGDSQRNRTIRYAVSETHVTFRSLSQGEIYHYVQSNEGLDKAGGYGIQGLGMVLVSHIEGEYSNVVGLPVSKVLELLRATGQVIWGTSDNSG